MCKFVQLGLSIIFVIGCLFNFTTIAAVDNLPYYHQMEIEISPDSSMLKVKDQIRIPEQVLKDQKTPIKLEFSLHANLTIDVVEGAQIARQYSFSASGARPIPL